MGLTGRDRELHVFRGHQPSPTGELLVGIWWAVLTGWHVGFIMGHEFTGVVKEVGSEVKTVKVGDKVVAPFTVSWWV